jgi:hypothetical protein
MHVMKLILVVPVCGRIFRDHRRRHAVHDRFCLP